MNDDAMGLIEKRIALLAINISWCSSSTDHEATRAVLDSLANNVKEIQDLFDEVWKKGSSADDLEFMKSLYERYGGNGIPRKPPRTSYGDVGINKKEF